MFFSVLPFLALLSSQVPSETYPDLTLDGGSTRPSERLVSYSFTCPDGVFVLEVRQKGEEAPAVTKVRYANRAITEKTRASINGVLARLRTLESIAPRCRKQGGVMMLVAGIERGRVPAYRLVTGVTVDKRGHVSAS